MVIHIVLFKWKSDASKSPIAKVIDDLRKLKGKIPEIVDLYYGENFSQWSQGYTHALVVKFKNKEDLEIYRNHPLHTPLVERIEAMEENSMSIDFEA